VGIRRTEGRTSVVLSARYQAFTVESLDLLSANSPKRGMLLGSVWMKNIDPEDWIITSNKLRHLGSHLLLLRE
jgi:hypothetical protein